MKKKFLVYGGASALLLLVVIGFYVTYTLWRHDVFKTPTYDVTPPTLPEMAKSPRVLVFSKTNSFRHVEAIPVSKLMFAEFAKEMDWSIYFTENAAVIAPDLLKHFDLVVWNYVSGDVFTTEQRDTFKAFLENGGKVLAIHASGGDPSYLWAWHPTEFIRAQFIGHPLLPQFQTATVKVENPEHPAMKHLPLEWSFKDEWYSFKTSPRERVHVLASLDESSYSPAVAGPIGSLAMGDHPIVWYHQVGKGTVFYSALGHLANAYKDENYRELLKQACLWLLSGADAITGTSATTPTVN